MNARIFNSDLLKIKSYFNSSRFKSNHLPNPNYYLVIDKIIVNDCFTKEEYDLLNKIEHSTLDLIYFTVIDDEIKISLDEKEFDSSVRLLVPDAFGGKRTILIERLNKFFKDHQNDERIKQLKETIRTRVIINSVFDELDNSKIKYYSDFSDKMMFYAKPVIDRFLYERDLKFYTELKLLIPGGYENISSLEFKSTPVSDEMKEIIINEVDKFVMKRLNLKTISKSDIVHWIEEASKDIFSEDEKRILFDGNLGKVKRKTVYLKYIPSHDMYGDDDIICFTIIRGEISFNVEVFDVETDDGIMSYYMINCLNNKLENDNKMSEIIVSSMSNSEKNYFEEMINILWGIESTDDINESLGLVLSYIYSNDCSEEFKNIMKDIIC